MAFNLRILKLSFVARFFRSPWGKAFVAMMLVVGTVGAGVFIHYYNEYARAIEGELDAGPFADMSVLYAAPRPVMVGQDIEAGEIASYLRQAGYSEDSNHSRMGWFRIRPDAVEINPGPDAYDSEGAVIKIADGRVTQIISTHDQAERGRYFLEPEPISNLFGEKREKRRIMRFDEIPDVMVKASLAAEDKNFFSHIGFDPLGIMRAAWHDIWGDRLEGASTITQQVARTLWLGEERGWRRKIPETLITLHLERKLSKQQIFEYYANSIYVGNQGSFVIRGFGQGAQAYFGKDLREITLPEAALLAGLPQGPSPYDPFRHPDRAVARRNTILRAMLNNEYITQEEYDDAAAAPLEVNRQAVETSDAPYFVDLARNTLRDDFSHLDFENQAYRVYTTLDLQLQRDAVDAVREGIIETDEQWKKRDERYGTDDFPLAQVALVAIDAETGEVKALVGGRSYGFSQLDHAVAKRQPGSSFKPFVYAAAMATALDEEAETLLTPASTVVDEPTTFWFNDEPYEPKNHGEHYNGVVTLREALKHSYNVPAVKVAEMIGYEKVKEVATAVGLPDDILATPSMALGSYEVTPLQMAQAYTVFPNKGELVRESFIRSIRENGGPQVFEYEGQRKQVLDPRVTYLVENMLEDVLRSGTGAGVRTRGFYLPAAGKTGTSRDGWFVGFTSKLITAVWVGFDDNRDFMLEGAHSALPIWTEFMKRAHEHYEYSRVRGFDAPDGIITLEIDADTGELATAGCENTRTEVFIAGTQPVRLCRLHSRGGTQISSWDPVQTSEIDARVLASPAERRNPQRQRARAGDSIPVERPARSNGKAKAEPRKGFLGRLKDIFH